MGRYSLRRISEQVAFYRVANLDERVVVTFRDVTEPNESGSGGHREFRAVTVAILASDRTSPEDLNNAVKHLLNEIGVFTAVNGVMQ